MPKWDSYLEDDSDEFEKIKTNKPKQQAGRVNRKDDRRELRKHKVKQREQFENEE